MKSKIALVTAILLCGVNAQATHSAPVLGGVCTKLNSITHIGGKSYYCLKVGKKMIWAAKAPAATTKTSSVVPSTVPVPAPVSPVVPTPPSDVRLSAPTFPLTADAAFLPTDGCKIKSTISGSQSLGFPQKPIFIPSTGMSRGVTLFVDFTDLKDDGNPLRVWKTQQIPTAENYYKIASYGKLDFKVDAIEKVYHINKSVLSYNLDTPHSAPAKPNANPGGLVDDAMNLADADVDFSKYDFVNVVTPNTTLIGYEGAIGLNHTADGKLIQQATFGPIREYADQLDKYNWLIHESGHLLGLMHPFNTSGNFYPGFVIPAWDLMGDSLTTTPEFLAWNKFILGWLDSSQLHCLSSQEKSETTHLITPISDNVTGTKAAIVRISDTQALVVENRRASTLNTIERADEGTIVYVVDGTIEPGKGAITMLYNKVRTNEKQRLNSTFQPGESISYKNVTVKVLASAVSGDYVSITIS